MGTTAEKLAYLDATKTAIKDAIIAKGVEIPEGTTFRQYADLISGISTGLSDEDLAKATATPGDVTAGKTFYAGNRELKTGTASAGNSVKEFTVNANDNVTFQIPARDYLSIFWETTSPMGIYYGARLYQRKNGTFSNLVYHVYSATFANTAIKTVLMVNGDEVIVSVTDNSNNSSHKVVVVG